MKPILLIFAAAALLLVGHTPRDDSVAEAPPQNAGPVPQTADRPDPGDSRPPLAAAVAAAAPAAPRPEVWIYEPESCPVCVALHREVTRIGAAALPFVIRYGRLDELAESYQLRGGPWLFWPSDVYASGWAQLHGLYQVNGSRLSYLLQEWHRTQPAGEHEVPESGQNGVRVCCCGGVDMAACLCADELRAGIERGPCTCTPEFGSRHQPTGGPAGGYRPLE